MKKLTWAGLLILLFTLALTACGSGISDEAGAGQNAAGNANAASANPAADGNAAGNGQAAGTGTRTLEYLGQTYQVPAKVERIVITGSMESMEDALVLDVHPVGAISFGGAFPERFAKVTDQAESIGRKSSLISKRF